MTIKSRECGHVLVFKDRRLYCEVCKRFKDRNCIKLPYHVECGTTLKHSRIAVDKWHCEMCNELFMPGDGVEKV